MLVHCYTTWDTIEQLEVFLERGYTFMRMLGDVAELDAEETHRHGEDLLMASRHSPPARSFGYRDVGQEVRHSRRAADRAWVILAVLVAVYLAWTLTVYFLEPGLR